jgi:hypothetical protein
VTQAVTQAETELSEEEYEIDPSADGVEIAEVQGRDNRDVESQDPEDLEVGHAS